VEPGFGASFGISGKTGFPFGLIRASGSGPRVFGLDDPQLQSVGANIHDERSVADALIGTYGVVMRSIFTSSRDKKLFIPCTSSLPNE
jgi:hypothetical protein